MKSRSAITLLFGTTILLSAFLVFQVQPMISKAILPWFGGTPAVWTTCMLFFQVFLFGGYCYAHFLSRLDAKKQLAIHLPLLLLSIALLPIIPEANWKPEAGTSPAFHILLLLAAHVGLPYFLLSSTGPLVQSWFSRTSKGDEAYRLYALSNIGSLTALLSYPIFFEPSFSVPVQGQFWSIAFGLFVAVCSATALAALKHEHRADSRDQPGEFVIRTESETEHPVFWWIALPALASVLLLATTNHVCQDVAVIPFLWIVPLSLYLITFIICFDRERWYSRSAYAWATVGLVLVASLIIQFSAVPGIVFEAGLYLATMFCGCMICHGELVRLKPDARYLTKFYLLVSLGGAIGGLLVAVICPLFFNGLHEQGISLLLVFALAAKVGIGQLSPSGEGQSESEPMSGRRKLGLAIGLFAFAFVLRGQLSAMKDGGLYATRNFYGVLRLTEEDSEDERRQGRYMMHGRIAHGFQHFHPKMRNRPTMYYTADSGVGIALANLPRQENRRIGVVGLGVGTLAAYGESGDFIRFYEINPEVERLARKDFTFLADCQAENEVVLGDARLSMERETPANYDLLVLDAFSGDALPAHLMTSEAFEVFEKHLANDGVIAFNISNRHLDLERVLTPIAADKGYGYVSILVTKDVETFRSPSLWFVMSKNREFIEQPALASVAREETDQYATYPLWTDQYNNLLHILK